MSSRVALVTGSTSGIGRETAKGLSERGMSVILHGRNRERGKKALQEIKEETGNDSLELMLADFSSFNEIRDFARTFKKRYERLDILINNAGIWLSKRRLNEDGIELTFAVNHLSHFLLTNLLLDLLDESAPSRIINVSSEVHEGATIDFDHLTGEEGPGGYGAYKQSKIANILFTYELDDRLQGTGITVNCLHPGGVRSRLGRDHRFLGVLWKYLPTLKSPKKGAETSIYLATSNKVKDVTGKYFVNKNPRRSSPESYDEKTQKRLWEISSDLTGLEREEMIPKIRKLS